ncbi:flagellin [Rubellimicrobium sp. CFH 75288]|uniref:flagellin N-terminal helical domain-containing protein n=1 Tax=Rubellimicrobium sp. CFH 75288 TaxID=2697034 RepID=UPI001411DB23|nr:flagellin [Rubellimicrobium sp. CFH 75288]NAZ37301.1 flagellin [Rubellimicrobium sp. CFH 75288]
MSSILTNTSAMVALQTLKGINQSLAKTQDQISTGKSVATAKDNAAVWAISKVMESDVQGFKAISDSLSLGQSTVAVARQAAETVTDLLTQMKGKIVAAQEQNVDRVKIQTDIEALKRQIGAVVGAAQFNGLNLLSNTDKTAGTGTVNVLSSLDRTATGVVTSAIGVAKRDLGLAASNITGTAEASATNRLSGAADATAAALAGGAVPATTSVTVDSATAGFGFSIAITAGAGSLATGFNTTGANQISYVARDGDTAEDVAKGLAAAFNRHVQAFADANPQATGLGSIRASVTGATVTFTGANTTGDDFSVTANGYAAAGNTVGGGLAQAASIDVSTTNGARAALREIEGLIQTSVAAAASFGSAQSRIETQAKFVSGLSDSLRAGIGSMVDADMEEASARLQALQVQQQLGIQALSIANQAPQSILSLFR